MTGHVQERRPATYGRVLWMLAASAAQVRRAEGLPGWTRDELVALLTSRYGEQAGAHAGRVADVVRGLLDAGASGALRLAGSESHVLVQLVTREATGLELDGRSALLRDCDAHGVYRTLGEGGSHQVGWAAVALPVRTGTGPDEADDVWS